MPATHAGDVRTVLVDSHAVMLADYARAGIAPWLGDPITRANPLGLTGLHVHGSIGRTRVIKIRHVQMWFEG